MVLLALGTILGAILAALAIGAGVLYTAPIKRRTNQIASTLKEKGKFIELDDEQFTSWTETLPKT